MSNRFTFAQQENLLAILGFDDEHCQLVVNLVSPDYFTGDYKVVAERCMSYIERYGTAPKREHILDLLSDIVEDKHNRRRNDYLRLASQMEDLHQEVNTKYVMDQANAFIRKQRLTDSVMKSADLLQSKGEHSVEEIEELWASLLRADKAGFSPGLRVSDYEKVLEYLEAQFKEFDTGIPEFDKYSIVPYRGAAMLFLASTGMGKTWWLTHICKRALLMRKKVLHVSLEMSEEECAGRFLQTLFSISKRHEPSEIIEIEQDKFKRITDLQTVEVMPELAFQSNTIRDDLRVRMSTMGTRLDNLIIKRFPPRSLSPDGLRRYLDTLERVEGFVPDLVSLDYLGITRTDAKDHRISLGRNFEEFRAISVERNHALSTAHQISRAGAGAKFVDITHIAEDWSLVGTADRAVVYSATPQEFRLGLARLFAAKARSDVDKFGVLITQNYSVGQFVLDSVRLDDRYWDALKDVAGEDTGGYDNDEEDEDDDD